MRCLLTLHEKLEKNKHVFLFMSKCQETERREWKEEGGGQSRDTSHNSRLTQESILICYQNLN